MAADQPLIYKIATDPHEFELIHRLNYRTFVEEIPQHAPNPERRLVDRFHEENTYIICMSNKELLGMIALRGNRPFSLDFKLDGLDSYLPLHSKALEIRLLAIERRHRKTTVLLGMMMRGVEVAKARGYDIALISGTTRQLKLYEHLGFQAFGPLVGTAEAQFQPMYLTWDAFETRVGAVLQHGKRSPEVANFLPGPVAVAKSVFEAFQRAPISHRSDEFARLLERVRSRLCDLTHATDVAVLQGSGTLANDVVGAQLSLGREPGLVLSNGEFGERLVDHADALGLDYVAHRIAWGAAFDLAEVERVVASRRDLRWLWAVHCETSTGVLNDLDGLKSLARRRELKLCMDCVSSVGAVDTNLSGVHLAAGVSGKSLAALPGLALVFIGSEFVPIAGKLPRCLDLAKYRRGVPFTLCSNLLVALDAALVEQTAERRETIARGTRYLREQLAAAEVATVADASVAAPHVTTIKLPQHLDSTTVAKELTTQGLLVAFASEYLRARNWLQVCLMGEFTFSSLDRLASALARKPRQHLGRDPVEIPALADDSLAGWRGLD